MRLISILCVLLLAAAGCLESRPTDTRGFSFIGSEGIAVSIDSLNGWVVIPVEAMKVGEKTTLGVEVANASPEVVKAVVEITAGGKPSLDISPGPGPRIFEATGKAESRQYLVVVAYRNLSGPGEVIIKPAEDSRIVEAKGQIFRGSGANFGYYREGFEPVNFGFSVRDARSTPSSGNIRGPGEISLIAESPAETTHTTLSQFSALGLLPTTSWLWNDGATQGRAGDVGPGGDVAGSAITRNGTARPCVRVTVPSPSVNAVISYGVLDIPWSNANFTPDLPAETEPPATGRTSEAC